jgi:hypothetical protein
MTYELLNLGERYESRMSKLRPCDHPMRHESAFHPVHRGRLITLFPEDDNVFWPWIHQRTLASGGTIDWLCVTKLCEPAGVN